MNKFTSLFYGWRMIGASCAIRLLGGGLHAHGFTIFFLPVTQELGLTRAEGGIKGPLQTTAGLLDGLNDLNLRWR